MEVQENEDHQCPLCDFKSTVRSKFENHIRLHTREKPFLCDQCQGGFASKQWLNQHKLRVHQGLKKVYEKKFKCSLCPYATHNKVTWENHTQVHLNERSFPCQYPDCKYVAKTSTAVRAHNTIKHKLQRKVLCKFPNCGYRGKTAAELRNHSVAHTEDRPFVCDFEGCNYQAKRKQTLQEHKHGVHNAGYKPFACSVCNYCTTAQWMLTQHELTHSKEKPFKCNFSGCAAYCKTKTCLRMHVLNCHTEKQFKCDIDDCLSTAASLLKLKEHKKRVHFGKAYNCPYCVYQAAYPSIIRTHIVRHKDSQRIQCPTKGCAFQATNHVSLYKHLQQHKINLGCPLEGCGYVGHSSSSLKRHMQLHDPTGRPCRCPLCPKCFITAGGLSQHLQTHTLEKPFQCSTCNYGTVTKSNIIRHMRVFHTTSSPKFDEESVCDHCNVNFGCTVGLAMHRMKLKTAVVVLTRLQLK